MVRSLSERLSLLQTQPADNLKRAAVGHVFRAVGFVTHMPYPVLRLRQLKESCNIADDHLYKNVLCFALRDMDSKDWQKDGEELMAQLLIEPFAAMHEAFKEDDKYGHV